MRMRVGEFCGEVAILKAQGSMELRGKGMITAPLSLESPLLLAWNGKRKGLLGFGKFHDLIRGDIWHLKHGRVESVFRRRNMNTNLLELLFRAVILVKCFL